MRDPTIIEAGALTPMPDPHLVPALIVAAGEQAGWRYVEFFTGNIRNLNARRLTEKSFACAGSSKRFRPITPRNSGRIEI
jgi:hypothetical protein